NLKRTAKGYRPGTGQLIVFCARDETVEFNVQSAKREQDRAGAQVAWAGTRANGAVDENADGLHLPYATQHAAGADLHHRAAQRSVYQQGSVEIRSDTGVRVGPGQP